MNFLAWLGTLLSSGVLASALLLSVGWLARTWIKKRIDASIDLQTGRQLAEFTRRLDAAEARITAVRDAGIDANLQLNAVVVAERVAAIKAVWKAVVDWRAASATSGIVSAFTLDYVRQHAGDARTIRSMQQILQPLNYPVFLAKLNTTQEWRPFVTERGWALFMAYHGFYIARLTRAFALTMQDPEMAIRMWEVDSESQVVRATAPAEIQQQYAANVFTGTTEFLGFVEKELLQELQRSLAGEHNGPEAQREAARMVAAAQTAVAAAQTAAAPQA
jgi:hypothetical protein